MSTSRVTTQEELDQAIAIADKSDIIYIDSSPTGAWLSVRDQGSSTVVARGSSRVVAWGSSRVVAWGSSRVVARESSATVVRGSARVVARESSTASGEGVQS